MASRRIQGIPETSMTGTSQSAVVVVDGPAVMMVQVAGEFTGSVTLQRMATDKWSPVDGMEFTAAGAKNHFEPVKGASYRFSWAISSGTAYGLVDGGQG